ncbi:hypothetical protein D3C87_1403790 [compost metagenome]
MPLATPFLFSMICISAEMPSEISANARFWAPPSTSLIGSPRTIWPRNCVTTREEPSFDSKIESSPAPIQLNGRNSV